MSQERKFVLRTAAELIADAKEAPESKMSADELLAYLRDQFDEPTLDVELWSEGTFRVSVTQQEMDKHYINDEFAWGKTPRAALLNCIHRHGKGMKRERLP